MWQLEISEWIQASMLLANILTPQNRASFLKYNLQMVIVASTEYNSMPALPRQLILGLKGSSWNILGSFCA